MMRVIAMLHQLALWSRLKGLVKSLEKVSIG